MFRIEESKNGVGERSLIDLSENSRAVLERRYLRRGADGKPIETVESRNAVHQGLVMAEVGAEHFRVGKTGADAGGVYSGIRQVLAGGFHHARHSVFGDDVAE